MIEMISGLPEDTIGFSAKGKVTAEDYEKTLIPMVEEMLKTHDKLNLLYNCGEEFEGFELAAMWDDAKVGLGHLTHWNRVAFVTDIEWMRVSTKIFGFFLRGHVKVFSTSEIDDAKKWVSGTA